MSAEAITLLIAFWGAITGTLALGWDAVKWWMDAPKLRVTASPNMQMLAGNELEPTQFIAVNAANVGRQQTKITHLVGWVYRSKFHKLFQRPRDIFVIQAHEYATLPVMLAPGDQWTGLILQSSAFDILGDGILYVGVIDTLGKKPALALIKKNAFKLPPK